VSGVSTTGGSGATNLIVEETPARKMSNAECRIKEFFLFYLLNKQSEAIPAFVIRQSSFVIS